MGVGKDGALGSQRKRKTGEGGTQPGDDNILGEGVMTTNATEEVPGSVLRPLVASARSGAGQGETD